MSLLHDEFEAVKHAPSQLVAFVHSLIARVEAKEAPAPSEPVSVPDSAPEGAEHV